MADKFTAAESIRRLAVQYQDMIAAADALEAIGKLEQVTKEQQAQAEAARAEADKAKAELAKAKEKVKAEQDKAAAMLAGIEDEAKSRSAAILRAAEENAAIVAKKAQDEAAKMIAQASTEKARLSSEIGGLQRAIEAGKAELAATNRARDEAESSAADAEKRLEQIKGKLKDLLA